MIAKQMDKYTPKGMVRLTTILILTTLIIHDVDAWRHKFNHGRRGRYYGYKQRRCPTRPSRYSNIYNLPNGRVELSRPRSGNIATFTCNKKYTLCGPDMITCTSSRRWDRTMPVCIPPNSPDLRNITVTYGNSRYLFSKIKRNATHAKLYCESLGGNLVAINSKEEMDFISCTVYTLDRSGDFSWFRYLGITQRDGHWVWHNGEKVTYNNWWNERVQDATFCAAMTIAHNYEWRAGSPDACTYPNPFIFEFD